MSSATATDPDDLDDDPTVHSVRIAVAIIIAIFAVVIIVLVFFTQSNVIRAIEFGSALIIFVLAIVECVL